MYQEWSEVGRVVWQCDKLLMLLKYGCLDTIINASQKYLKELVTFIHFDRPPLLLLLVINKNI